MENKIAISFGVDCYPGSPRPDAYAKKVFEYLGLEYINPYSMVFGAWEWEVSIDEDKYHDFDKWMRETMDALYESGRIRGARWGKLKD